MAKLLILCLLLAWPTAPFADPSKAATNVLAPYTRPAPSPDATWQGPDGATFSIADFAGKVVLVNFWATWCPPCVTEMPDLDALQKTYGPRGFEVVAISADAGGLEDIKPFYTRNNITALAPHADPRMTTARAFGVRMFPTSFLIGRDGRLLATVRGVPDWHSKDVITQIERALSAPLPIRDLH